MSSSARNKTAKIPADRPSQPREMVNSFHAWVLDHFGTDTLQKARMAIIATESEKEFLCNELDAQKKVVKGLTTQNSQMSAQLLKLSSLLTRKGELRNREDNTLQAEDHSRSEHEQTLLLVLQEIFKSSPMTIQEISRITSQEQRLSTLANTIKMEAARVVDASNLLQAQINTELNAPSLIIEKDRVINNLETSIDELKTTVQQKDRHILLLQCQEQEGTLKLNALAQQFEELQARNNALNDCTIAMQARNEELKEMVDVLNKKISELEEQEHLDTSASRELMAISVGLDTSLSVNSIGLQNVQDDLEKLAAETQVSMTRLINNCDHSVLTSRLIGEEKMCGPDWSEAVTQSLNNNEAQQMDYLQRIWAYVSDPEITLDGIRAYITDEISKNRYSNAVCTNNDLQKNTRDASLASSSTPQMRATKAVKSRISKSIQTDVSLSQVSKMLVNEKRLRDKVSLLENRLKERESAVQSLEEKFRDCKGKSIWLEFQETRITTPPASYMLNDDDDDDDDTLLVPKAINSRAAETQTDPRLSLEAPDPSWPDFQEKMSLFETTLNNLYLALQQQKAQAGPDLQIEDLATTIRTQILEALNGTAIAPVSTNDRALDLTIITDDIINYDRSLLHLQQKKSEQRPNSKGMFSFWK